MGINKKAQIFTLIGVLLISLLLLSFEMFSFIQERQTVNTRVKTMNSFLFSTEKNLERQIYISGFRTIYLAENEITSKGSYINVTDFFNEAFFNGTVNNQPSEILIGATYADLINSLNQKAKKINVEITLTNTVIDISQHSPWEVKYTIISDFVMNDKEDLAKWEKKQNISAIISIIGFEDPLHTINTYAKVSRKINKTIYSENYSTNLLQHVEKRYYEANPSAPSFLKRLEGDLSPDKNGIESFVYLPDLSSQGIPIKTKSAIDYIYFSIDNPESTTVPGMPSWFQIDSIDNHTTIYQL